MEVVLAVMAAVFFVVASVLAVVGLVRQARQHAALTVAALGALCLCATLAWRGMRVGRFPAFGGFEASAWYALSVTGACLYVGLRHKIQALPAFLLPYVSLFVVAGVLRVGAAPTAEPVLQNVLLPVHVTAAFLGYGLFTMESCLAVIYLVRDRDLKRKHFGPLSLRLPSLETLDHLMIELIGIAFLLFTVAIGLGIFLAHHYSWGARWITDPKVVATGATWVVYAVLFYLRTNADRHGRDVACVAVAGLFLVLLAFLGVHLVADSIHNFGF